MLDTHTTTGQRTHNTLGKLATDWSIIHQARAPRNVGNVALFRNSFYFVTNRPGHRKGKQNREGERESCWCSKVGNNAIGGAGAGFGDGRKIGKVFQDGEMASPANVHSIGYN